jgi:uncharacterized protein
MTSPEAAEPAEVARMSHEGGDKGARSTRPGGTFAQPRREGSTGPVLLVVAKAPVPGFAKTRLAAAVGPKAAAELATASLLDTLTAAAGTGWPVVVALTGDLDRAPGAGELREALVGCTVIGQRGDGLGERLAAAHADAASVSRRGVVVQIGADTPQVESGDLVAAYRRLAGHDAVLGPADDGGWWLLAARQPALARCLIAVPMSRSDTGALTVRALRRAGRRVAATGSLRDVDTAADAEAVAAQAPASRFAIRWAAVGPSRRDCATVPPPRVEIARMSHPTGADSTGIRGRVGHSRNLDAKGGGPTS